MAVLSRVLTGVLGVAAAAVVLGPGMAFADPPPNPVPQPPTPNVNGLAPVKPSEYAVLDNQWYAFASPEGLTCVLQKTGGYGCNGAIPGAPEGANLVGGQIGAPASFAMASRTDLHGGRPRQAASVRVTDQLPDCQLWR